VSSKANRILSFLLSPREFTRYRLREFGVRVRFLLSLLMRDSAQKQLANTEEEAGLAPFRAVKL
jgi:hypothetical protein